MPKRKPDPKPKPKARRKSKAATGASPRMVRKNLFVDQTKLDIAKRSLGVETDTEAIDRALTKVTFAAEFMYWIDRMRDAGGLEYYPDPGDEPHPDAVPR